MSNCQSIPPCPPNGGSIAPSPLAPWQRPVTTPLVAILVGDATINITYDKVALMQTTPKSPDGASVVKPYFITLPNGNYIGQWINIYIPGQNVVVTANFLVNGAIAGGFVGLLYNNGAFNALLYWDGNFWQLMGGNAQLTNQVPASYP